MQPPLVNGLVTAATKIRLEELPNEVIHNLKLRILDTVGICFATHTLPFGRAVLEQVRATAAPGQSSVISLSERFTAPAAAFANGVLSHGAEMDDCHIPSITHPGSTCVPVVLAMSEDIGASGAACLEAAAIAYELLPRVSLAVPGRFHERGLQTTSMCAPLVNALTAAKLLKLNAGQMAHAAGLGAALAGGLRTGNDDGSWTKRLFSGWSAQTGITAAQLAARGFTGPGEILESRFGLYRAHLGDVPVDFGALTAGLGEVWETLTTSFRRYPCSFGLNATIECCLKLRQQHRIDTSRVKKIECRLPEAAARWWFEPHEEKCRPPTTYAAMFSIPYVVGVALVHGEVTVPCFEDGTRTDPKVLAVIDKTYWTPDTETPFPEKMPGWVILHMTDGAQYEVRQPDAPGTRENPLSENEILLKFRENCRGTLTLETTQRLLDKVMHLEKLKDTRDLMQDLRQP